MIFDNRPPINLEAAEVLAAVRSHGGYYHDIGWRRVTAYKGKRYHLIAEGNSGCDFGTGPPRSYCQHLGLWPSLAKLVGYVCSQVGQCWWASELLEALDVEGEEP